MKYILSGLVCCNLLGLLSPNTPKVEKFHIVDNCHLVIRIDSIKNVYLIYTKKGDSLFEIYSLKEDALNSDSSIIKVGGCYDFRLENIFSKLDTMAYNKYALLVDYKGPRFKKPVVYDKKDDGKVLGVKVDGVDLYFDKKYDNSIFISKNIKGLVFIPDLVR